MDGCGVLHPARCGSASHLGAVSGLTTVGVAKNLLVGDLIVIHSLFMLVGAPLVLVQWTSSVLGS